MPVVESTAVDVGRAPPPSRRRSCDCRPSCPRATRAARRSAARPAPAQAAGRGRPLPIPGRRSLAAALAAAALAAASSPYRAPRRCATWPAPALKVCCGLTAELYASGLKRPTAFAFGPDGLLYATQETGEVVAVGRGSSKPRVVARGFATPLGLTWVRLDALRLRPGLRQPPRRPRQARRLAQRIVTRLPFGRHQQDTIALGPDGRLYLGSGSTCDACKEKDRRSGAILSFRLDGSDLRIVATGLRNPFGLVFDGDTLYVSVNARDDLGDTSRPRRSCGSSPAPTTAGRAAGRAGGCASCRARAAA